MLGMCRTCNFGFSLHLFHVVQELLMREKLVQ